MPWSVSSASACAASHARRDELFGAVFVRDKTDAARAIFTTRFFKEGLWHEVAVDDRVPAKYDQPQFAKAKEWRRECWPMVVEKAYAKLHGSYHAIEGGLGVLDVAFHPTQPWLFSCGADGTVRLFQNIH